MLAPIEQDANLISAANPRKQRPVERRRRTLPLSRDLPPTASQCLPLRDADVICAG
jgi:hypothetical protein